MDTQLMTHIIFILGILTVVLSCVASRKFCSYRKTLNGPPAKLSNAVSLTLLGEAILGLGTLIFATAAHYGVLPNWPIEVQSALRFVMLAGASGTTLHLMLTLNKIEKLDKK